MAEGRYHIFHDGMTQWWTTAAQEHMTARGFEHRQMRILGSTCAKVVKRYRVKLVGDTPELCRGLGAHGFADLNAAVTYNCALASYNPVGHPIRKKWSMGILSSL